MDEILIISNDELDKDGMELKRARAKNPNYIKANGKTDNEAIDEALVTLARGKVWTGLGNSWERIFGGK